MANGGRSAAKLEHNPLIAELAYSEQWIKDKIDISELVGEKPFVSNSSPEKGSSANPSRYWENL